MNETAALLAWYDANRRDLPWRRTKDPYAIWVSEAMLQQTQVATVIPYWHRWMEAFPTLEALAAADEQRVLALWQGLGYYRRGRLLRHGAQSIVANGMPSNAAEWRQVPGVGPYTAAAIASIAQGESVALVDGNVERVYARLTGDGSTGPALFKAAWKWADRVLFPWRPGDWNQALMELGATVCRPTKPSCADCPLAAQCIARQTWRVDELPTKIKPATAVKLHQVVWIPVFGNQFGVRQIPEGAWWEGMWEFPRADASQEMDHPELRPLTGAGWLEQVSTIRHSVTYHRIRLDVLLVRVSQETEALRWVSAEELTTLPMPSPQRKAYQLAMKVL